MRPDVASAILTCMSKAVQKLLKDALALPREERARVAHELIVSLEAEGPADEVDDDNTWAMDEQGGKELQRRIDEMASGKVKGIAWEAAFDRIDARRAEKARARR